MSHSYLVELVLDRPSDTKSEERIVGALVTLDPTLEREGNAPDGALRLAGAFHAHGGDMPADYAARLLSAAADAGGAVRALVVRDYEAGLGSDGYPVAFAYLD